MSNLLSQQAFYTRLQKYDLFDDKTKHKEWSDWDLLATIEDIKYYAPHHNKINESIIAVSEEYKVATHTGSYNMDDMRDRDSGFIKVVSNGVIMCKFEAEE